MFKSCYAFFFCTVPNAFLCISGLEIEQKHSWQILLPFKERGLTRNSSGPGRNPTKNRFFRAGIWGRFPARYTSSSWNQNERKSLRTVTESATAVKRIFVKAEIQTFVLQQCSRRLHRAIRRSVLSFYDKMLVSFFDFALLFPPV